MTTIKGVPVPPTEPGASADLQIPMTAPTTPGDHSGQWRLRSPNSGLYGVTVSAKINVPSPTSTASSCVGTPYVPFFTASPTTLTPDASFTLSWGFVVNADMVEIDQDIGGVATPGSATLAPPKTTTYTLTAHCGATSVTRQVSITVASS